MGRIIGYGNGHSNKYFPFYKLSPVPRNFPILIILIPLPSFTPYFFLSTFYWGQGTNKRETLIIQGFHLSPKVSPSTVPKLVKGAIRRPCPLDPPAQIRRGHYLWGHRPYPMPVVFRIRQTLLYYRSFDAAASL